MAEPAGRPPLLVVGGGAVRAGAAGALRELVARTDLGVLNTYTAKGLFPWDSPVHLGTIGLQERDLELAGVPGAEVVLIGVEPGELDLEQLHRLAASVREVAPHDLDAGDPAALGLPVCPAPSPRPELYTRLADACASHYAADAAPLDPARAAADLAAWLPDDGMVAADAAWPGFWIGRTFPTRRLGSVVLPVAEVPGFAVTQAATAARTGRLGIAVVDRLDDASQAVLERVARVPLTGSLLVEVWRVDGPRLTPVERLSALESARAAGGPHVCSVAVDEAAARRDLVGVAGVPRWG